ncbi:UbiD family decarboxylase [Seinonella peptonophila]|uniref:UbiD family decarboxylase n=2 Tax=Seinonella peptonophila TaxID=112248 RepID=A0A1M4UYC4_9BACL|nr:UbiD family decarboxylase [Seinonella peptonophila]
MHKNLRSYLKLLYKENEIVEVDAPVDPALEIPEIHRRIIEEGGPALLFTNPKGSKFPIVTNLFGTPRRIELAFGPRPEQLIIQLTQAVHQLLPPRMTQLWKMRQPLWDVAQTGFKTVSPEQAPVLERQMKQVNLNHLPALTSWPEDGGAFFTLPLVYTEHPDTKEHNLGVYRMQIHNQHTTGMHWQIHKGGGFHHQVAEKKRASLPVSVFLGGPPALTLSAIAALPEMIPEYLFASFIMGDKLHLTRMKDITHPLIAEAEFAFCGSVPALERRAEGPFGDHFGYYSLTHDFPIFEIERLYHRKDAIFPATVVGKPRQEDYYIGEYMLRLFSPIFPMVMPGVKKLWSYAESGFHALTGAIVRESYHREAVGHAFRIMGEGQLSLTKFLMLTDIDCDLSRFSEFLELILARFQPERDLIIIHDTSIDTLDYTGRKFHHGSKAFLLGIGDPVRELPSQYQGDVLKLAPKIKPYCKGCLLISGASFEEEPQLGQMILDHYHEQLQDWPLIFLVDDVDSIQSQTDFLWTTFTRFDPAHDIYAQKELHHNKINFQLPLVIDARMKPFYPAEVEPDEQTIQLVDTRWKEYFTK